MITCPLCREGNLKQAVTLTEEYFIEQINPDMGIVGYNLEVGPEKNYAEDYFFCDKCKWKTQDLISITCKFCHQIAHPADYHLHQDKVVCDNCWDDRLKMTE